jgi:DHA1 family bicyclomycin/chloramphenicol resistance-like MFS transporter
MKMPIWLPLLLGFLTAVGPVSTDMYLPAFPAIEAALGAPSGSAQITLGTWFAGLAVGQITLGTLSDRYGRRVPLMIGTLVYALASAACAVAPSIFWLSVFRAAAAVGGSAGMVIPRAMVRDLADGHAAARLMSRLMLVMGAAPILAPTLGGLVLGVASWRVIFWIGAGYGLLCAVLVWRKLPDTLPAHLRVRLGFAGLLARYAGIARERGFLTHAVMGGFAMFAMFAYIAGSPPVLIGMFAITPAQYGLVFGGCACGYIAASQINARILPRFGSGIVMRYAARTALGATGCLFVAAFTGAGGLFGVVIPLFLTMTSAGFMLPNTTVGALSRHSAHAASASALMGMLQFVMGAVSGTLAGALTDGTPRGMAALMLTGAAGATTADIFRGRAQAGVKTSGDAA